ncbi:MAG TPA: hypothetical protein VGR50_05145, partial [Terriglobales bacterium]|nr:hypothetical protein [Terriglobales bacterium]
HADFHALAFSANGGVLYAGNDGGVWSTTDTASAPLNWTNLNPTLALTQFYPGMGLHPTDPNIMFGGSQDNGTQQYGGNATWTDVGYCGDGSAAAIDFVNTNNIYINCNSIDIAKSTTGGTQFSFKVVGGTDPFGVRANNGINTSDRVKFIPPLIMDPNNSQTLYFGTFQLYQTTNGAALGNANSWVSISPDLTSGGTITAIAVAPSDSNVIFVGTDDGNVQVTSNALSGAATWSLINSGLNSVTSVAVEPANAATVYVGLSDFGVGHVLRSTNSGGTWADISGNLPDIPVNAIVVDPNIPNTLYIGTDVGAFTTSNDNAVSPTWTTLGSGLPNVAVLALGLQNSTRTLVAGTHGRSAWTLALPGGFTLGTPSASSVNVAATGTSTPSITFRVTALGALAGPVNLTCPSGLPSGAVCNFSPSASVTPTVGSPSPITLTVTTAGSPVGASVVTIAANSTGQPQQTQTFTLHVLPDYTYTVSNLVLYTRAGTTGSFNGTLTTGNGYSNSVSITCAGNPAPLPATCTPPVATTPTVGGVTANVTAGNSSTGDFNIHLNAVGSDPLPVSQSQPVTLHVVNASFTVNPTTPISVAAGSSSGPIALQIGAIGSFTGSVTLSCSNALPAGATCSFAPSATVNPTAASPSNVTMIINSGSAAATTYSNITVNGAVTNPSFNIASTAFTLNISSAGTPADLQATFAPAAGQPAILPVGTKASFTVIASNNTAASGTVSATVIVSVSAPNLLAAQNGCSVVGASLSCPVSLTNGAAPYSKTFTTAPLPFGVRSFTATATVSAAANPDPNSVNNTQATPAKPVGPRPISRRNLTTLPK